MIYINNCQDNPIITKEIIHLLQTIGEGILHDFHCHEKETGVLLIDDKQIREYNRQYRGMDQPTDVLAFSFEETTGDEPVINGNDDQPHLLGDVLISVERAVEQAEEFGHSFSGNYPISWFTGCCICWVMIIKQKEIESG